MCLLSSQAAGAELSAFWQQKVNPELLQKAGRGETEFLVVMADQADLSPARALSHKQARGRYVFTTLTDLAARSQPEVVAVLAAAGADYRQFWIANMISAQFLGMASKEMTSMVTAKAKAASRNTSIRVMAVPRSRKPLCSGH